jgi:hypothetical protein
MRDRAVSPPPTRRELRRGRVPDVGTHAHDRLDTGPAYGLGGRIDHGHRVSAQPRARRTPRPKRRLVASTQTVGSRLLPSQSTFGNRDDDGAGMIGCEASAGRLGGRRRFRHMPSLGRELPPRWAGPSGQRSRISRLRRYVLGVTSRRVRYDAFHEVFEPLEREAMLWRYIDFTKLIALLETGSLHFARTDQLNDPFEGSMTGPMAAPVTAFFPPESLGQMAPDAIARADSGARVARQQARMQTYLCCWNHSEIESDALWGRYVQAEAGITIRSTFGRLVDCFGTDPLPPIDERGPHSFPARDCVFVGKVNYVDYETAVWPVNNGFWPFCAQAAEFLL